MLVCPGRSTMSTTIHAGHLVNLHVHHHVSHLVNLHVHHPHQLYIVWFDLESP